MTMTVEDAWRLLKTRMENGGATSAMINNAREYFLGGVYAASADVLMNRSTPGDLSEAAGRIEKHR